MKVPRVISGLFFGMLLLIAGCDPQTEQSNVLPAGAEGKMVFINYWAEWCKPCREEIPVLNQFAVNHADTVRVYGVNFDGISGDALTELEQRMGVAFPTLPDDPGPRLGMTRPGALPVTLIIDDSGAVVTLLQGEQTMESLEAALNKVEQEEEQ